jgi:argonaute-like protein implicated in RNA metabolism and viral defense
MRALPEQLRAAIAVPVHERLGEAQLGQRLPDRLMDCQRMRVDGERLEKKLERISWRAMRRQVSREGKPGAPVLLIGRDQRTAERRESVRVVKIRISTLEA